MLNNVLECCYFYSIFILFLVWFSHRTVSAGCQQDPLRWPPLPPLDRFPWCNPGFPIPLVIKSNSSFGFVACEIVQVSHSHLAIAPLC